MPLIHDNMMLGQASPVAHLHVGKDVHTKNSQEKNLKKNKKQELIRFRFSLFWRISVRCKVKSSQVKSVLAVEK